MVESFSWASKILPGNYLFITLVPQTPQAGQIDKYYEYKGKSGQ